MTEPTIITAIDKLAINEVIAKYAYTYDSCDYDSWYDLFTDDGTWELRLPVRDHAVFRASSKAELKNSFDALNAGKEPVPTTCACHVQTGTVFDELSAEYARTRTQCVAVMQLMDDDGSELDEQSWVGKMEATVLFVGVYYDQFRKVDGDWLFAERIFYPSTNPPNF